MSKAALPIPSLPSRKKWTGNEPITTTNQPSTQHPTTSAAPGMAQFGDLLFVVYKSSTDTSTWQVTYDGTSWVGDTGIQIANASHAPKTSDGPALAVYNGVLYMAYKSASDDSLWMSWLDSPTTASNQWQGDVGVSSMKTSLPGGFNPQTQHAPSLAVYNYNGSPALWMAWQYSSDFYVAVYQNSQWVFTSKVNDMAGGLSPESNYGPSIAAYNELLYMVFKARHSDDLMWATWDGTTWAGNQDIEVVHKPVEKNPASNYAPCIAPVWDELALVFKAAHHNTLLSAQLNNQVWSGNRPIKEVSHIDPQTEIGVGAAAFTSGKTTELVMAYPYPGSNQIYVAFHG
jgi:hypothetical protein